MAASGAEDFPAEAVKFDPVAEAKLLLRTTRSAALATLVAELRPALRDARECRDSAGR